MRPATPLLFCTLAAAFLLPQSTLTAATRPVAIGSVSSGPSGRFLDPVYKDKLTAAGYQVGGIEYPQVTAAKLKPFNVLVLQWAPGEGDTHGNEAYDKAIPILTEYAQNGGGLLVTYEPGLNSYKSINRLLKNFDAEILNESVIGDEKDTYTQKTFLSHSFTTTTGLNPDSPLTRGIHTFTYPGNGGTAPLRLGPGWTPVIKADESASSSGGTVPHAPVIAASRQFGRGRIVLLPMHTTYYINAGYHPVWEGLTMEKGHGREFLDNAYRWLAEPSLQTGNLGGYRETKKQVVFKPLALNPDDVSSTDTIMTILTNGIRKPIPQVKEDPWNLVDYRGLIGAHTAYSDGQGTPAEYVARAKRRGYQYIVFTEDLASMNEDKWNHLAADCRALSDTQFLAIPGLDYLDVAGNRYIAFNLKEWPNKEWLSPDGKRVKDTPGIYFGEDWAAISLVDYDRQYNHPWTLKFFDGLNLISYGLDGKTPQLNFADYIQVQANDYNLIPIASHFIHSPAEVESAGGYQSHAFAKRVADIPLCYRCFWYGNRQAYISNGPRVERFTIYNGWAGRREEEWRMPLAVADNVPITDIIVYDQKREFYHFRPMQTHFSTTLRGYHDQQRFLTVVVRDAKARTAITPALYTCDVGGESSKMCTDQQNTLDGAGYIHPNGKIDFAMAPMGYYNTNWDGLGLGYLGGDIMPPGLDYVGGGWGGGAAPAAYGAKTQQQPDAQGAVAQRDIVFCSGDVNILDNYFNTHLGEKGNYPTKYTDGTVRFLQFIPRLNSFNMMIVRDQVAFKKDFAFDTRPGPELRMMDINGPNASYANYSYIAEDGHKVTGKREGDKTIDAIIPRGGYMSVWPDFYGSFAAYPLQKPNAVLLKPGWNVQMGEKMAGQKVPAHTVIDDSFLLVRGKFGDNSDTGFDQIRKLYGLSGPPAYAVHLTQGTVRSLALAPQLNAQNYTAVGIITPASLPAKLGLQIHGINPNWDAGLWDAKRHILRRIGVFEGSGWLAEDISNGLSFVAGNLLLCNHPEARLHLFAGGPATSHGVYVEVHNPTGKPLSIAMQGNPHIPFLAGIHAHLTLQPGEDRFLPVELPLWLQWSEEGLAPADTRGVATFRILKAAADRWTREHHASRRTVSTASLRRHNVE